MKVTVNGREYDGTEPVGMALGGKRLHRCRAVPYWFDRGDRAALCGVSLADRGFLAQAADDEPPCSRCFPKGTRA